MLSLGMKTIPGASSLRLLRYLARNTRLEEVDFKGIAIENVLSVVTSEDAQENYSLKELTIAGVDRHDEEQNTDPDSRATHLVPPIVKILAMYRSLECLELLDWKFSAEGTKALCDALNHRRSIKKLQLCRIDVSPEAMGCACQFLSDNSSLTNFPIVHMKLHDHETLALFGSLARSKTIKSIGL